jgi:hypothetical protein
VDVYRDVVVKATFSEPVSGVDATTLTLHDGRGNVVPASVDQIGDGTWALFPHQIVLNPNEKYSVRLGGRICGLAPREGGNCLRQPSSWRFTTVPENGTARGDTRIPAGFDRREDRVRRPPGVDAIEATTSEVAVAFSEAVMNVNSGTLVVRRLDAAGQCGDTPALPGVIDQDASGRTWVYRPATALDPRSTYCLRIGADVYDLDGERLPQAFDAQFLPTDANVVDRRP